MSVRLLDYDPKLRSWSQADGGAQQARDRMTLAAWRLLVEADQRGLVVHVRGTTSTEIIGSLGHTLSVAHKKAEPGAHRVTRVRLCRHDGSTVEARYTLAQAHAWVAAQPPPLRRAPLGAGAARA